MTKRCMVKAMSRQDEGLFVTQVWFVFFLMCCMKYLLCPTIA